MSKKLFHCEVEFMQSPHLMQIYTGFFQLQQQGIIDIHLHPVKYERTTIPIIKVILNNQFTVMYDTQDGLSWINKSRKENLEYFQQNCKADFYFKRSFHKDMLQFKPNGCKIYPLGLNYNVHPDISLLHLSQNLNEKIKYFIKTNKSLKKVFNKSFFYTKDFEYYPIPNKEDKILFLSRVWDPAGDDVYSENDKHEREQINDLRVQYIEACKKEFGKMFTGGLWLDDFSGKYYSKYVMPFDKTNKFSFLNAVKEHNIGIATTGLYQSIGWKFAEYVAASRAIVSEPLRFDVPGDLEKDKNYLEFKNTEQLLEKIVFLLNNKDKQLQMMQNNHHYYNNYLRPDVLILNSLLTVINNIG